MTYKSPSSGAPVVRTVAFEMSSDDQEFLLAVLEHARANAQPYSQRAIDRLRDAITHRGKERDLLNAVDRTFHPSEQEHY